METTTAAAPPPPPPTTTTNIVQDTKIHQIEISNHKQMHMNQSHQPSECVALFLHAKCVFLSLSLPFIVQRILNYFFFV